MSKPERKNGLGIKTFVIFVVLITGVGAQNVDGNEVDWFIRSFLSAPQQSTSGLTSRQTYGGYRPYGSTSETPQRAPSRTFSRINSGTRSREQPLERSRTLPSQQYRTQEWDSRNSTPLSSSFRRLNTLPSRRFQDEAPRRLGRTVQGRQPNGTISPQSQSGGQESELSHSAPSRSSFVGPHTSATPSQEERSPQLSFPQASSNTLSSTRFQDEAPRRWGRTVQWLRPNGTTSLQSQSGGQESELSHSAPSRSSFVGPHTSAPQLSFTQAPPQIEMQQSHPNYTSPQSPPGERETPVVPLTGQSPERSGTTSPPQIDIEQSQLNHVTPSPSVQGTTPVTQPTTQSPEPSTTSSQPQRSRRPLRRTTPTLIRSTQRSSPPQPSSSPEPSSSSELSSSSSFGPSSSFNLSSSEPSLPLQSSPSTEDLFSRVSSVLSSISSIPSLSANPPPNSRQESSQQPSQPIKEQSELKEKKEQLRRKILDERRNLEYNTYVYSSSSLEINVHRQSILKDTIQSLAHVHTINLLAPYVYVRFIGEDGYDVGGLTKEWVSLMSKHIFNPVNEYFTYVHEDNYSLQINPKSNNEDTFPFIGKFFALALYHGHLLGASLIRPFYKQMLGKSIELEDVESFDPKLYESLIWMRNNDVSILYRSFTWDVVESDGTTKEYPVVEGGEEKDVDNSNKEEYIKAVLDWKFVTPVKKKMGLFLRGFREIIPLPYLEGFSETELELALCGSPKIDIDDWQNNTGYVNSDDRKSVVIKWFWEVVREFDNEMKMRLLQFVTGSSKVPAGGFADLNPHFTIFVFGATRYLPEAHTCANQLDLPLYTSKAQLKNKLEKAVKETEGFFLI